MLANAAIIESVAAAVVDWRIERLVVDPVMVAQSGAHLLEAEARKAISEKLMPLAEVVTPNVHEAAALTGFPVGTVDEMEVAARELIRSGARAVLLKGGHLQCDVAVDVFDDGRCSRRLQTPRIDTPHTHGTGCQISAAIAANLALGRDLLDAIEISKRFITAAIRSGLALGQGNGPANPLAWLDEADRRH
jgi:hydroxymethylpyrimidine/phosphomethylpyrimidine kinase